MNKSKLLFLLIAFLVVAQVKASTLADSVITISLKAIPGLQYDLVRFKVKPGAKVIITLTNADDMSHNLLITQPGAREDVVNAALQLGESGPKKDFIPSSPKVLWAIPVLGPQETKSITFTAPAKKGIYPYVCTYPGHGFVMYGAMYVTDETLPAITNDLHIPPARRKEEASVSSNASHAGHIEQAAKPMHPYKPVPPYVYRVFIADASPAAIAVNLPNDVSYCWDAGTCRLRFAWQGGFLDNRELWKGKGDVSAKVTGTIFYRDKTEYPLRINKADQIPAVDYKGYQLISRYPEFHYTINGTDVYELLKPKADGSGLVRTFRIPDASKTIWFISHPEDGVQYASSTGEWKDGKLKLTSREARQFTITMSKKEGVKL